MMGKVTFKLNGLPKVQKDEDLFISLDFPVQCPKCRAKGKKIKKDGRDKRKKDQTQRFKCKRCCKRIFGTSEIVEKLGVVYKYEILRDCRTAQSHLRPYKTVTLTALLFNIVDELETVPLCPNLSISV